MPTLAFVGGKGGPGKSTTAISLAVEWQRRGLRVLLVDADDVQRTAMTWADLADEYGHPAPTVVAMGDSVATDLPPLAAGFDVTILDTPGRGGRRVGRALAVSHFAVLPCGPAGPELWSMPATLDQVRDVQAVRPELGAAILVTKKQPGTVLGAQARRALLETEAEVLETEWHYRVTYGEAISAGLGPTTYEPASVAAAETQALANELERRLGLVSKPVSKKRGKVRAV